MREKGRERYMNVQLSVMYPQLGTWPTTQACALTGNRTCDPLVCRLALNPLSHHSQGCLILFFFFLIYLRERHYFLLFQLLMHSLVASCMCSDQGSNLQLWYIRTMLVQPVELSDQGYISVFKSVCCSNSIQV